MAATRVMRTVTASGISTTYDLGMGISAGAAYTSSDRTND